MVAVDPTQSTPSRLSEMAAGMTMVVTELALAISLAALLFSGPLSDGLPRAVGAFVFGAGVVAVVVGRRTKLRTALGGAQDLSAIVLLTSVPQVAAGVANPAATMLAVLVVASAAFGLTVLLVTRFRLTQVGRYLPSTVVMGFVAGTGLLLFRGGLQVMRDAPIELGALDEFFGDARLWLPGLAVAVLVVAGSSIERLPAFTVGLVVLVALAIFYLATLTFSSIDAAEAGGWFVGPFRDVDGWRPITPGDLTAADWGAVGSVSLPIAAAVFVSMVGLLLNLKGLQSTQPNHVDFDHEMRSAGFANLLVAPVGGLIGFHNLGDTTLAVRVGIRGAMIPTVIGGIAIAAAVFGGGLIGYLPRFVVGGVLASVGVVLVIHWLEDLRVSRSLESLVSLVIVVVSVWIGMLEAVGVGILAASAIFLVRYSRVDPIRLVRTGNELSSSIDRTSAETAYLAAVGEAVRVYEVQGYLFFGSIEQLHDRVSQVIVDEQPTCVIIDFRHVTGLDRSAVTVLNRLAETAAKAEVRLLWSNLRPAMAEQLGAESGPGGGPGNVHPDLDHALEEAENLLLASAGPVDGPGAVTASAALRAHLTEEHYRDGDLIEAFGAETRRLYLIDEGRVVASLPNGPGGRLRLREFGVGSIFGEIGFRLGRPRTADLHAVGDVAVLTLERDRYEAMIVDEPSLALELNELMLDVNFQRIMDLNRRLNREYA